MDQLRRSSSRLVVALAFTGVSLLADTIGYFVTDLGTVDVGSGPNQLAINNSGQVVGSSGGRAFLWQSGIGKQALGILPGYSASAATDINDNGIVVGTSCTSVMGGPCHAFIWQSGIGMQDLTPTPQIWSGANGINNSGLVVGFYYSGSLDNYQIFSWQSVTAIRDLGLLGGTSQVFVGGINNVGQLVGTTAGTRGFIWQRGTGIQDLGTMQGFPYLAAYAINDTAEVVGESSRSAGVGMTGGGHAFLWENERGMLDLGVLPGASESRAFGISNNHQIVGSSGGRAFVYSGGEMIDLNSVVPTDLGWTLSQANAINDAGQIVATSRDQGQTRAFLLTPDTTVPEPATYLLCALSLISFHLFCRIGREQLQHGLHS